MAFQTITKVKRETRRLGISGPAGWGKSSVIPLMSKNPIVYDLENKAPDNWTNVQTAVLRFKTFNYILESLKALRDEAKVEYDWVWIDSLSELEKICEFYAIANDYNNDKKKYSSYSAGQSHELVFYIKSILDVLEEIENKHKINVGIICHTGVKPEGNPDGSDYQVTRVDVSKWMRAVYEKWLDYHGIIYSILKVTDGKVEASNRVISFDHTKATLRAKSISFIPGELDFDEKGEWIKKAFKQSQEKK